MPRKSTFRLFLETVNLYLRIMLVLGLTAMILHKSHLYIGKQPAFKRWAIWNTIDGIKYKCHKSWGMF